MRFDDYVCFNCSRALVETSPGTWECEHCGAIEQSNDRIGFIAQREPTIVFEGKTYCQWCMGDLATISECAMCIRFIRENKP